MNYVEVIQKVVHQLRSIQVPIGLTEQITIPIFNAASDLQAVVNGVIAQETQRERELQNAQKESAPEMTEDKEDIENVGDESGVSETGIEQSEQD